MCGIAGLLKFDGSGADAGLLHRMIDPLRHRGPDGTGIYTDRFAGLAHARLSVIDIAGGQQPMHNEDRTLWITFNGEIFNYLELKAELLEKGHHFATRSDTEVILHLYEEKGEDCVRYLNGQWAFAIWDARNQRLFLSRDRLGVRPLFYTAINRTFIFGSEVKSIFAHPEVNRALDLRALDQIFTFWFTLPPRTIFQNIWELPPGHSLVVENEEITLRRHWQLDFSPRPQPPSEVARQERDYADQLLELLLDAIRLRLRADVPVGAYLSGGLDSTVTTALIKRFTNATLKTFSVSFDDPEFDESGYQQEAVRFLDTAHQDVRCSERDIGRIFPDVIWHTEKPILRTAPAPLYILSGLVRESGFKVVITGEGSDEMLGGYDIFKEAKIRRFWAAHPDSKLRPLLLKRLYPYLRGVQSQSDAYRKAFFRVRPGDLQGPFFSHLPRWELTSKLKIFFSDSVKSELNGCDADNELEALLPAAYPQWDGFCQAQYLEAMYLLPGYILSSQGDRVAMAHSVEGRFPFLDYRVVEFAATIPPCLKMKVLNEKYLLKQCAGDLIPLSVRKRPKQPYRAPEGKSFFSGGGFEYVHELLSPERIRRAGIFDAGGVEKLAAKFRDGRALGIKDNMALVGILSTQLVVDQFIDNFTKREHSCNKSKATCAVLS